jgi:DNA-binding MarR family transcriptional regulator
MFHDRHDDSGATTTLRLRVAELESLVRLLRELLAQFEQAAVMLDTNEPSIAKEAVASPLVAAARNILTARRRRARQFSKAMFGEPAWDMLLALYAHMNDGPRHSIGRLVVFSGAPSTTALRWLDYLEKGQLVMRCPNPTDRRSEFIQLTDKGRAKLEEYLSETLTIGK